MTTHSRIRRWPSFRSAALIMLLCPAPCWAATGALPWDRTLFALQDFLVDSLTPAIIVLAFVASGILFALSGHDKEARRLAGRLFGSGIGGCIALAVVKLLNYVLP